MQDKIVQKAAERMMDKTQANLARVLESIHAHLEKILEVEREHYNYVRAQNGDAKIDFRKQDKLQ